jgi:hypothetical protein
MTFEVPAWLVYTFLGIASLFVLWVVFCFLGTLLYLWALRKMFKG